MDSIWPKRKWLDEGAKIAINECINYYQEREDDLPSGGHFFDRYCEDFSNFQGGGYSLSLNSGTNAMYACWGALGLKEGDIVGFSPVTDFGSVSATILRGLKINVCDSSIDSFNTNVSEVRKVIKNNQNMKAIVITHIAGQCTPQIDEIIQLAKKIIFLL